MSKSTKRKYWRHSIHAELESVSRRSLISAPVSVGMSTLTSSAWSVVALSQMRIARKPSTVVSRLGQRPAVPAGHRVNQEKNADAHRRHRDEVQRQHAHRPLAQVLQRRVQRRQRGLAADDLVDERTLGHSKSHNVLNLLLIDEPF